MLFGKSLFQSVVDRLDKEAEDEVPPEETAFRINGLASSFVPVAPVAPSAPADPGTDQRLDAYLFLMPEEREPEPPAWIDRLSPDEVAADLGLDPSDDRERLQERRRAFARDNHPDRIPAEFREEATMRMKTANRLIDDALSRCDPPQGR
ncbi:MAG: DnaJ family molecular chaperone [Rhizobium rhizophilum]|uniref:J domain-containing protein n=1 Tax=Rhizobium rhizophilum TaxID=1850373 RepID=UPI0039195D8B